MRTNELSFETVDGGPALTGGPWRRAIYIGLGAISVALGTIGLFLPGVPTTVFLIVASWLFARSSPRLHGILLSHPRLGPPLRRFLSSRTMPRRAKIAALASMWGGIGVGLLGGGGSVYIQYALIAAGSAGTLALVFCVRTRDLGACE